MSTKPLKSDQNTATFEIEGESEETLKKSNKDLWKVILLALVYFGLFTAYNSAAVIFVPLFEQLGFKSFGTIQQLCVYGAFFINDFLAAFELRKLKLRLGLFFGGVGYVIFILGGLHLADCYYILQSTGGFCSSDAIIFTNSIGGISCGVSAGLLWLGNAKYIDCCSNKYNKGRYYGVFWGIFMCSTMVGNFIGAYLLKIFSPFAYFVFMSSVVLAATIAMLFLPEVHYSSEDQEILKPIIEDIKSRIRGIMKVAFLPSFRPLLPYYLFLGYSGAIMAVFPYKVINLTLGGYPENIKNERVSWAYSAMGVICVITSSMAGTAFDVFGMMKTINTSNIGFLVSMAFGILAMLTSQYGLAVLMVVSWSFSDVTIRSLANAIMAKDFKGRLDAFAASRVITESGTITGLLINLAMSSFSTYWVIFLSILLTLGLFYAFNQYDSSKVDLTELEKETEEN